jgi:hypothetical protein
MIERCGQCGEELPQGFGFCGKCGSKLGTPIPWFSKDSRERKTLENDIAEVVAERLIKFGKLAATIFLTAASVVAIGLGAWGYTTLSSAKNDLQQIVTQTKAKGEDLKKQVDSASADITDLGKQYKALGGDLEHYRQVNIKTDRLQKDLQTINGQIVNWYSSLESEQFDSSSGDRIRFVPYTLEEKRTAFKRYGSERPEELPFYHAILTLNKIPIPASVKITRYSLSISPGEIKVNGREVTFGTPSDKFVMASDNPGAPIYVQYHPMR